VAGGSNDTLEILEILDGGSAVIATTTFEATANDQFFFEAIGSTLTIYINGTQRLQTTDATYGAAGYIGLDVAYDVWRVGEFGGGTVVAGGAPTVTWVGIIG
jgi:hypothetical protein